MIAKPGTGTYIRMKKGTCWASAESHPSRACPVQPTIHIISPRRKSNNGEHGPVPSEQGSELEGSDLREETGPCLRQTTAPAFWIEQNGNGDTGNHAVSAGKEDCVDHGLGHLA